MLWKIWSAKWRSLLLCRGGGGGGGGWEQLNCWKRRWHIVLWHTWQVSIALILSRSLCVLISPSCAQPGMYQMTWFNSKLGSLWFCRLHSIDKHRTRTPYHVKIKQMGWPKYIVLLGVYSHAKFYITCSINIAHLYLMVWCFIGIDVCKKITSLHV